jgi:hypothetical protein
MIQQFAQAPELRELCEQLNEHGHLLRPGDKVLRVTSSRLLGRQQTIGKVGRGADQEPYLF